MKKRITKILFFLMIAVICCKSVGAFSFTSFSSYSEIHLLDDGNCWLIGEKYSDIIYYLQLAMDVIKYVGIILCIVLSITDGVKAITSQDADLYKPLVSKFVKRLIYVAVLFFVPVIVNSILNVVGGMSTCGIG